MESDGYRGIFALGSGKLGKGSHKSLVWVFKGLSDEKNEGEGNMKIYSDEKGKKEISSEEEWFKLCPPKKKEKHWKSERSAKEMAKFWLDPSKREEFQNFIKKAMSAFDCDCIIPEYVSKFDDYRSPRNHDLYIAEKNNRTVITVEGKVDEPFGNNNFEEKLEEAKKTKDNNPNSKKLERLTNLDEKYFHKDSGILKIRYQLLTWFAGAKSDAERANTDNFFMVLQEFKSDATDDKKLQKNHGDFENFIEFISEGKFKSIEAGQILEPIANKYTGGKNLYIGYYSVNL
ncbi:MAG: hypothetical protein FWG66_14120 [Spirochaetes bacterium]|nr:hypothetical protein [Spirochaetota bacterium]